MTGEKFKIIHFPTDESPFLVVDKSAHIPSAPLFEGDDSILTEAVNLFPEIALVHGKKEVEHGLVHRIDTETSGLVLIATSQKSYDALLQSQKNGKFEKWYRAEVDLMPQCAALLGGFPPPPVLENPLIAQSFFRPFGKNGREVRPVTGEAGKSARKKGGSVLYTTEISFEEENVAICHITAGFRHQVRCHLAWCGFPVKGDKIYNPLKSDGDMKFSACRITFPHPLTQIPLTFQT